MAYSKALLTGSTNGRMIKVAATATPGTAVHTAVSGTTNLHEIWLFAVNSDTSIRKLTIEFGGVAAPDDLIEIRIPAESGLVEIMGGFLLQNGLLIKAFAETANVVMVGGWVNLITP